MLGFFNFFGLLVIAERAHPGDLSFFFACGGDFFNDRILMLTVRSGIDERSDDREWYYRTGAYGGRHTDLQRLLFHCHTDQPDYKQYRRCDHQ